MIVFGAGALLLLAGVLLTLGGKSESAQDGGFVLLGAFAAVVVGELGSLLAWWGRRPRAPS